MPIQEESVGIRCYVSESSNALHPTFKGSLRHRYSDFRVNEVDLNNRVARVTIEELPSPKYTPTEDISYDSAESVLAAYRELYPGNETSIDDLREFLEQVGQREASHHNGKASETEVTLQVCDDKAKRTQVHAIFRKCPFLPVGLVSRSGSAGDLHTIVVTVDAASKGAMKGSVGNENEKRRPRHQNQPWSGGKEFKYVKFVMEKTNLDSNSALDSISRMLRVPQRLLAVAGTKDKRAITTQFVTAHRVEPRRLAQLNKGLAKMNVRLGNFEYASEHLGLGDLSGNRFEIVLRGVTVDAQGVGTETACMVEDVIRKSVIQTKERGFINYFGLQRFGTGEVPTHVTGELLLCGKWKEALDSILTPGPSTQEHVRRALEDFLVDRDAGKALHSVSKAKSFSLQRTVLEHLKRQGPADYPGALQALPKAMKALYVGAFHSYVWNNVVSERIQAYGPDTVLEGDLVIRRGAVKKESGLGKRRREQRGGENESISRMGDPHVVTNDDVKEGRYNIDDVVLPLPGTSVKYPENQTAAMYEKYNARITGGHTVKSFMPESYPGDYRHIMYRPSDLACKMYRYTREDEEIPAFDAIEDGDGDRNGSRDTAGGLAAVLRFYLPSSTYATMCIREITRMPTDIQFAKAQRV